MFSACSEHMTLRRLLINIHALVFKL